MAESRAPEETFDPGWLALREPLDHRSRPESLIPPLLGWWADRGPNILDLGCGTGSNLRYLAPRLPGDQAWTLVDHDAELLARIEPPTPDIATTAVRGDLEGVGLAEIARHDLVTASALLDLVSERWLNELAAACTTAGTGALFALSVDGRVDWGDVDPDDMLVRDAVNAHQRRDKGLGPALGPTAGVTARALFEANGYRTWLASSPWRVGPEDARLALELIDGWAEAATETQPNDESRIAAWADRRRAFARGPDLQLIVGHVDLLALPSDEATKPS